MQYNLTTLAAGRGAVASVQQMKILKIDEAERHSCQYMQGPTVFMEQQSYVTTYCLLARHDYFCFSFGVVVSVVAWYRPFILHKYIFPCMIDMRVCLRDI